MVEVKGVIEMASSGKSLNRGDMIELLKKVDAELLLRRNRKNERFKIILVGGAVMVLYGLRDSSMDLDAYWRARRIQKAIDDVAKKNNLKSNWFNKDFKKSPSFSDAIYDNCKLLLKFDCCDFYAATDELMLCMKLIAGRTRVDKNDFPDILNLINRIQQRGEEVTQTYINTLLTQFYNPVPQLNTAATRLIMSLPFDREEVKDDK